MATAKLSALDIQINGLLSPSLLAAINRAEAMLKSFGVSNKTQAAALSRVYNAAFGSMSSGMAGVTSQANKLHASMHNILEIGAGVTVGELFSKGLEKSVSLIHSAVDGMIDLGKKASDAANEFELLSKGMGAIIRDQGFANNLLNQLQQVAYKSPFQLTELGGVSRALAGRGMGKEKLFGATTELGDITAGLGGGKEILDRLSLAYGEAFDEKTITKRVLNQFSMAGVPMMDAVMKAIGLDPSKEGDTQKFFKMVHDKEISFGQLDKAIYNLTHNGGLFTDGMIHFALTFKGIVTTFLDMWNRMERDFGNIINDWAGMFLKWVNDSSFWNDLHNFAIKLRSWSDYIRELFGLLSSDLLKDATPKLKGMALAVGDFFKKLTGGFDPSTMYKEVTPYYADYGHKVYETTAAYDEWHKKMFGPIDEFMDRINGLFVRVDELAARISPLITLFSILFDLANKVSDILYGKIVPFLFDKMIGAFDALGKKLHELFPSFFAETTESRAGAEKLNKVDADAQAAQDALTKYQKDAVPSLQELTGQANAAADALSRLAPGGFSFGNFPIPGARGSGYGAGLGEIRVEGYGPMYGENGQVIGNHRNPLGMGDYAVSPNLLDGHTVGSTFSFVDSKGVLRHGRYEDTSMKAPGVPNRNIIEGWNQEDRGSIKNIQWDKPPVTINYHIHAMDATGVERVLRDHGDTIAEHVRRANGNYDSTRAVV